MIYSNTQPGFSLTSSWYCVRYSNSATGESYFMVYESPSTGSRSVTFPVNLPIDAVVQKAWISCDLNTPFSGARIKRINGSTIPADGICDVDGIVATTTEFRANFTFQANGQVYHDYTKHYSSLQVLEPTLHISYTSVMGGGDEEEVTIGQNPGKGLQLPRLLGADWREVERLRPCNLKLSLRLSPLSNAVMQLPPNSTDVPPRAFVELFDPHGSVGIFRVMRTESDHSGYRAGQKVYLDHAFCTLSDNLVVGVQAMSAPVRVVVATLLTAQTETHWVLGDCDVPEDIEFVYSPSEENLLQALTDIMAMLPDQYAFEFEMERHPFTMHIRKLPDAVGCEFRANRNVTSAHVSIDTYDMCTRVLPYGAGKDENRINLAGITGSYFLDSTEAASRWGYITRSFSNDQIYDALTLKEVAQRYLDRHDHPSVSITVDGSELSELTGESFDRLSMGKMCALELPDVKLSMLERLVGVDYPDVYGRPTVITATLSAFVRKASDEIAQLMREATNSKLLGGKIDEKTFNASHSGATVSNPLVRYFQVEGYGNVIRVSLTYTQSQKQGNLTVDGTGVGEIEQNTLIDITPYLKRDENGVVTVGDHWIRITPNSSVDGIGITATITVTSVVRNA